MSASAGKKAACGVACFHPSCLMPFVNVKVFTGFYSASALLTSSLALYIISQVTTIEKQFNLSSTQSGWLMSCNDIGYSVCILFASFFANKLHVPRVLCLSTILYGISGIICSVPHFMGLADLPDITSGGGVTNVSHMKSNMFGMPLCSILPENKTFDTSLLSAMNFSGWTPTIKSDGDVLRDNNIAFGLLAFGMVLQGIGKSPRYPMLAQFIDDNTKRQETGFYMGIITSLAIFGPAIAYGLGGLFADIYVTLEDVNISRRDPRWIGAWWIGFLLFGIASLFAALPLMCFPRKLSGTVTKWYTEERRLNTPKMSCRSITKQMTGLFKAISRVLMTPVYTLTLVSTLLTILSVGSTMSFGPKYMEQQFSIPAWKVNIILAVSGIFSVSVGTFLGGYLTRKIKLNPRRCLLIIIAFSVPTIILMFVGMFLYCDQPPVQNWSLTNSSGLSTQECNQQCGCNNHVYLPICGQDGRSYFSPCHAGCISGSIMKLTDCTCIPGGTATLGLCTTGCKMLWPFTVVSFVTSMCSSFVMMPSFLLFLRSVPNKMKSLAIGISALTTSLLGWLPAPVIGGKLVDSTCLLWRYVAGSRGACSMYDTDQLRYRLYGMAVGGRVLSLLVLVLAFYKARNMHEWPVDDEMDIDVKVVGKIYKPNREKQPESDMLMTKYKS